MLEHFPFPLLPVGFVLNFSVLHWLAGMALEHFPLPPLGGFASGFIVFRCVVDVRLTFTWMVAVSYTHLTLPTIYSV